MKNFHSFLIYLLFAFFSVFLSCNKEPDSTIHLKQLNQTVEVIRDQWGVNHIYAKDQHDLFFTQGYMAARDRLFQFEIWRRQATGTVSEILGPRELKRDIGARLFMFRGNMKSEMDHYHPEGEEIIIAYVDGVNAYIQEQLKEPDDLPIEFKLLNIKPHLWTPEVVISRHKGLLGNIASELNIGRAVAKVGSEKVNDLVWFHPKKPVLELDTAINGKLLDNDILELYYAYRNKLRFLPSDLDSSLLSPDISQYNPEVLNNTLSLIEIEDKKITIGSNNWIVSRELTKNGHTLMANDPHRSITIPSLRYMVHLVAPGWNVIGGGEPEIPGISIGHNEHGAWGLTVFKTDGEDLYVYDINPDRPDQYKYKGKWESMKVIHETIKVKGVKDTLITLKYTRHGPVCYIDIANQKAYAVRCAWLEPGGAPYLASLRMDQADSWDSFRNACAYSNIPGENMIWAGTDGTIGWQAVGIAPVRRNFSGLVPVPGDGRYEWDGYLPIKDKPHLVNPENGFYATANQNVTPENYTHWDAIGYLWSDPYRGNRINEVLSSGKKFSMKDFEALQTDYFSIPAQILVPYLKNISFSSKQANLATKKLFNWNYILDKNSIAATIYAEWEKQLMIKAKDLFVPEEIQTLIPLYLTKVIAWIQHPDSKYGPKSEKQRDLLIQTSFMKALNILSDRLGSDIEKWQYGQEKNKHITINHILGNLCKNSLQDKLNVGPAIRGGYFYCVGMTGYNPNQTSGASFKIIVNTGNWDDTRAMNTPGQSGNPDSPYYKNLFNMWANDQYFPLYYSREKIETVAAEKLILKN
ncbi:MAG: penicillin acylase family protein [Bacteroidales bacterium]|nr:penicillin acylase family protein [Bacteroidales bacterium]